MKKIGVLFLVCLFAVCVAGIFIAGCETGGDTVALTVEPSFVDLTSTNSSTSSNAISSATQTFVCTGGLRTLSLPLVWSVSDPNLGSIGASGGQGASYIANYGVHGNNSIKVRDQYGAEGVATVRQ